MWTTSELLNQESLLAEGIVDRSAADQRKMHVKPQLLFSSLAELLLQGIEAESSHPSILLLLALSNRDMIFLQPVYDPSKRSTTVLKPSSGETEHQSPKPLQGINT